MTAEQAALLDRLAAEARLRDLVTGYADVIDWLDWNRLDTLFWPDARFDFGMFKGDYAEYRGFVVALEESYRRRLHMFAMPLIRLDGTRARIDAGSLIVCRTDDDRHGIDDIFHGRYIFTAEARDGEWRLSGLTYILNLFDRRTRAADDRDGPMNFGDDLAPDHRLAARG